MKGYERIDGVKIDDLNVYAEQDNDRAYYSGVIDLGVKEGGGAMILDVRAEGYTGHLIRDHTREDFSVKTSQVHGRRKEFTLPEGYDFALMRERPGKALFMPDFHSGPRLPGFFSAAEVMSPVRGNPTNTWKGSKIEVGYTRKGLDLFFQVKGDQISTVDDGSFTSGDRWRIGVALGEPEKAKNWYEITVAADGKDNDFSTNARVKVRRFPDGKTIESAGIESVLRHRSSGRTRWGVWIPWNALGIDPASERFFIKRTISLDLAYIDVDNGKESGAWQFLGKSGVLEEKTVRKFKKVYLRNVNWDDTNSVT